MNQKEEFMNEREELNDYVMKYAGKEMKRFFSLDGQMYREGELDKPTKELLGLVASAVLRCDDCIQYHLIKCVEEQVAPGMIQEALSIAVMVGGSIVIPHVRRAFKFMDSLLENRQVLEDEKFKQLIAPVKKIVDGSLQSDEKLLSICRLLKDKISHYDWVGFYMVDTQKDRELVLGPYVGAPTDHLRIKFGDGICGQAAEQEISFVVQNVSLESNYLACSPDVKSEILSPIFKNGKVVGEIDIDSHIINPFTQQDKIFLEQIAEIVSPLF